MKILKYVSALLAVAMLAGCSGGETAEKKTEVKPEKSRYELLAECDGDIQDKFAAAGNGVFYIKSDEQGSSLVRINTENTEEVLSSVAKLDDKWLYKSDNWLVFYADSQRLMKYSIGSKELSEISRKDNMYNILLLDDNLFYLNAYGLLCQMSLSDDSVRMIDQSVPAEMANGIDDIFADGYNKENIYYWNSDTVTLMKYSKSEGLRYEMYKKSSSEVFYENWYAADDIVYNWDENGFKIIKENAVAAEEAGNGTLTLGEDGFSCYKKDGRVIEMKNASETDIIESMPDGYDGEPVFFDGGSIWFEQDGRFYTLRADNTVSQSIDFDGEILDKENKYLYAFGKSNAGEKNGIYKINLGIN